MLRSSSEDLRGVAQLLVCAGGMLLGLGTAAGFSYFMPADMLFEWGWRIPFIAGLFISSVGLYIRKNLAESPIYKKAKEQGV